jgi:hypothetical protein
VPAAALAVAVGVMFGPWLRSGSSRRTSFELVQAVDRLAVVPGTMGSVLRPIWSFVPFVGALALVFLALGRRRIAAALAVVVGALETAFAGTVQQAPRSADWGVTAGLVAGPALIVIAVASAWLTRKQRVP